MFASALSLLALASSALAITVTTPAGWTSTGPNKIEFKAVSTDPTSFAVVLVNQNNTILSEPIVLVKNQSTSSSEITITPGCGADAVKTLPVGSAFQINFVANAQNLNSISAQSNMFNITQGSGVSSSCNSASASAGAAASQTAGTQTQGSTTSPSETPKAGAGFSTSSLSSSAVALVGLGLAGFSLL